MRVRFLRVGQIMKHATDIKRSHVVVMVPTKRHADPNFRKKVFFSYLANNVGTRRDVPLIDFGQLFFFVVGR